MVRLSHEATLLLLLLAAQNTPSDKNPNLAAFMEEASILLNHESLKVKQALRELHEANLININPDDPLIADAIVKQSGVMLFLDKMNMVPDFVYMTQKLHMQGLIKLVNLAMTELLTRVTKNGNVVFYQSHGKPNNLWRMLKDISFGIDHAIEKEQ